MAKKDALALGKLQIPESHKMDAVMNALTDDGRAEYLRELYAAIEKSTETGDHAPVQFVVDAWWVSSMFAHHPKFEEAIDAALATVETGERHDADSLRNLLATA